MRRAGSLFEIDQEPLFEPGPPKADGAAEQGWEHSYDDLPPASAAAPRHAADATGAGLGGGRRSRMLVVIAAIGVAGFLGSRVTQFAGTPTVAPRAAGTSPLPPTAVAPAARSIPVQRRPATRSRRARSEAASRRVRVRRQRDAASAVARARQAGLPVSAPLRAVLAPAPRAVPPPAPEPQGFTGEFF